MTYSNTDYRICVYRSPERYDDYHREFIELPYQLNMYRGPEKELPNNDTLQRIRLQRFRASLHISYEMLRDFGLDFRTMLLNAIAQNQNAQALLLTVFQTVSRETDRRLREERGIPEHTIILDKVEIVTQQETDRLLVDMIFYACQHSDADLGLRYFQENLQRLAYNTSRTFHPDGRTEINFSEALQGFEHNREWFRDLQASAAFYDARFLGKFEKYDKNAEERALKLLESMLSKEELEIYVKDGYVMVEGKSHKMYKVIKNSMIEVSEKQKDSLYKTYRLCIEPKNHGTICPTDQVIAKIKLIQADENKLHKIANKFVKEY